MKYIVPLDDTAPDVYNDEGKDLDTTESEGWHPHHRPQHVFAIMNGEQDDQLMLGVDELLTNENWAELSDENDLFPDEIHGLEAGDELTVNWGHQPGP